ncbi:TPA: hypothetical protein ACGW5B_000031 [Bacillus paranthracis]|uniref:hypothetical protein n=1 Tax=Bacillus TaxID=1386 RepID=UPI000279F13F|nr:MULTISPECIES: hypothetical protein [Bacillus cereus group]EJR51983.1 hypothetical protein IIK_00525 [Bacillus cereus VD102]MCU4785519.1 hypothetical protein [Bacillus cereus]MCC2371212.1 hypothetical protein [Bacillus paranthracis]MCC2411712.1 hypothetical protein [Bacillus paranthracis]MCC2502481.1 hypothetical protein [Bacillus paranthracis]
MYLFEEEDEEQYEIEELKTVTIKESVQMKREQSKQRKQDFEEKLKVLKEKISRLKRELGYKD